LPTTTHTTHPSDDDDARTATGFTTADNNDSDKILQQSVGGPICKSIIAIGNTRLPPSPAAPRRRRYRLHSETLLEKEKRELDARPWQPYVLDQVSDMESEGYFESSGDDEVIAPRTGNYYNVNNGSNSGNIDNVRIRDKVNDSNGGRGEPRENENTEKVENDSTNNEDVDMDEEGEAFVCELYSGETIPIKSTSDQLVELRTALNAGLLISAVSTIQVAEETVVPSHYEVPSDYKDDIGVIVGMKPSTNEEETSSPATVSTVEMSVSLPPGSIKFQTDPHRRLQHEQRSLASYTGTKSVLIVRVNDVNDESVPESAQTISDKFFGTNGDVETMQSQFASCSYNNFNIVNNDYGDNIYGQDHDQIVSKLSAPGVLEIDIPISMDNTQATLRGHMVAQAQVKLGISLPGPFAHVLFVISDCYQDCGWAAYAYVNHWMSVYQSHYYKYPAVSMHELGHNLNLAHSGGLDEKTYTDHTCLMGNPLFSDDVGDMCFNPAKNYQIVMSGSNRDGDGNWYNEDRVETWDVNDGVGGTNTVWSGKLVGIAEYDHLLSDAQHADSRIVLKLESGRSNDLYVGFNRATGITSDNQQASNKVTITETGGNGYTYSQSMLKATMGVQGEKYSVVNWRHAKKLVVTVEEINVDVVPGYAVVRVELVGGPTVSPTTSSPTKHPMTSPPTNHPSTSPPTKQPTPLPSSPPTIWTGGEDTTTTTVATSTTSSTTTSGSTPTTTVATTTSTTTSIVYISRFTTPNSRKGAQDTGKGLMFTIQAQQDIVITGLDVRAARNTAGSVLIYTRSGSYEGKPLKADDWTALPYDSPPNQQGKVVTLGDFRDEVRISAGQIQSFFVYSRRGLLYERSDNEGQAYGNDNAIIIREGSVTKSLFRRPSGIGKWAGTMRYYMD